MVFESGRNTYGPFQDGQLLRGFSLSNLNSSLNIAYRVEILADLGSVAWTKPSEKATYIVGYEIQNAALLPDARKALLRISAIAVSKEVFEDCTRMVLHRHGRVGGAPTKGIAVCAAITGFTGTDHLGGIQGKFQRG